MSLQTKLQDFITAVGTDYKGLRVWITGSATGDLTGLTTTAKSSLVAAINEVKASATGAPPTASESAVGVAEIATTTEVTAGTDDVRIVTPLKLAQRISAIPPTPTASETVAGVSEIATQVETTTGTDDVRTVTPLKLQQRLSAWAQPLSANLTSLASFASGAFGRTLLGSADVAAARTSLGLSAVAISGSASDITTGTLPTSVMPPLAIKETFTAATQAAMLALTAQRGDVAIRSDQGNKMYLLASDSPATLADWKPLMAQGDVASVAGKTGAVTLVKADVGLGSVDNTSDAAKPVSTAQATADNLRLLKTANLSDVANPATALSNLGGVAASSIGDPETDLVALYVLAKA